MAVTSCRMAKLVMYDAGLSRNCCAYLRQPLICCWLDALVSLLWLMSRIDWRKGTAAAALIPRPPNMDTSRWESRAKNLHDSCSGLYFPLKYQCCLIYTATRCRISSRCTRVYLTCVRDSNCFLLQDRKALHLGSWDVARCVPFHNLYQ